jgi:hypothetical protein
MSMKNPYACTTVSAYMHQILLADFGKLKEENDAIKKELQETQIKLEEALQNQSPPKRPRGRPRKIVNGSSSITSSSE